MESHHNGLTRPAWVSVRREDSRASHHRVHRSAHPLRGPYMPDASGVIVGLVGSTPDRRTRPSRNPVAGRRAAARRNRRQHRPPARCPQPYSDADGNSLDLIIDCFTCVVDGFPASSTSCLEDGRPTRFRDLFVSALWMSRTDQKHLMDGSGFPSGVEHDHPTSSCSTRTRGSRSRCASSSAHSRSRSRVSPPGLGPRAPLFR